MRSSPTRALGICAGATVAALAAITVAACVGSDPALTGVIVDSGSVESGGGLGFDGAGAEPADAGGDGGPAQADAASSCLDGGVMVFPPASPNLGVFCGKGTGPTGSNHWARGDHCCVPPSSARVCAASCGGGGGDFLCNGTQDCAQDGGVDGGPLVCCAESGAALDKATCSYPIFTVIHHGLCQASCGSQVQLCAKEAECGQLHCVGATTPYPGYSLAICQ